MAKIIIELEGEEAYDTIERFREMEALFARVEWLEEQIEQLVGDGESEG